MGRRNSATTVNIDNDKGRIRLRWRYNSNRYSLNLQLTYKKTNLSTAKRVACHIEQDVLNNKFDVSLLKYKALTSNDTAALDRNDVTSLQCYSRPPVKSIPVTGQAILQFRRWIEQCKIRLAFKSRDWELKFFDRRQTVSGMDRGEQRKLYDQRRRDVLPKHSIKLIEFGYDDFEHTSGKNC
jgi:hypothetical protein